MLHRERALIARLGIFSSLDDAALDAVLAQAQVRRLAAGAAFFSQGQPATEFFLLVGGKLQVEQTTRDGQEVVVRHINPGELFGIARALGRTDYPGTATTVADSVALAWNNDRWDEFVATIPSFAQSLVGTMGRRMQEADARVRELSTEEASRRVARALLRLVDQTAPAGEGEIPVDFPVRRKDLASMAGTTLHTVSRIMSGWQSAGLITAGRQSVIVRDRRRLRELAEGGRESSGIGPTRDR
jgi:CRP-like cAMP-binding protein